MWAWVQTPDEPRIETDHQLMEQTTAHLREVKAELRGLPVPDGATDSGIRQVGCRTDSGDLFQPAAVRHWKVGASDGAAASSAVAAAMRAGGWTGSTAANESGSYFLMADRGTWAARAVLGDSDDNNLVYVEVTISDARPCRLAPA
jgi:hypothetical protein